MFSASGSENEAPFRRGQVRDVTTTTLSTTKYGNIRSSSGRRSVNHVAFEAQIELTKQRSTGRQRVMRRDQKVPQRELGKTHHSLDQLNLSRNVKPR